MTDSTSHPPADPAPEISRRRFLVRAGTGGALLAIPPWLRLPLDLSPSPNALHGEPPANLLAGLEWRLLGPFRGGRVDAVSGVPGRPNEFYFGHVNGGVWKTIDAGRVWEPVFDGQPVASIGALAVAPSAPDVIYVGSGESTLRDSTGYGNGMYKSTDAGRTWTHIGLDDTHHIGKIAVHPANPDIVFV
ncbi:MAG: WD40/YVTN/BNR-like repeat-containing protein, partial [Gemmatimonadota bacterium]